MSKADVPMELRELNQTLKLQAVKALSRLHEFGILHGNISSEHFLVQGTQVFLIDFGLSVKTTRKQDLDDEMRKLKTLLAL
jgi:tRNA A-37 threonylcarbamoyl transferase component Bud32